LSNEALCFHAEVDAVDEFVAGKGQMARQVSGAGRHDLRITSRKRQVHRCSCLA
jgi:hypothetical protein